MAKQANRRLHESTSRLLCRLVFIALGAVPVLGCLLFCCVQLLPQYQQWRTSVWEQRVSQVLGFTVRIAALDEATPTQAKLTGVRVLHPESKVSFARAESVEVALYRNQWLVRVEQAELEGRQLNEHWQLLHELLLCRPRTAARDAHVELPQLAIHTRDGVQQLHDISLKLSPSLEKTCMWVDFHVGPQPEASGSGDAQAVAVPIRLSMLRSHLQDSRVTEGQLRIERNPLPCSLMRLFWEGADRFGPQANVTGVMDWRTSPEHWTVTIPSSGLLFNQVDFERLTWNAPAEVAGQGVLRLTDTLLTERGVQRLSGVARVGLGRVSKRLLLEAEAYLGLQLEPEIRQQATREIPFEDACLGFEISPAYLRLAGLLDVNGAQTNGVLLNTNGIFARAPYATWPLTRLVRTLDRSNGQTEQVPAGLLARTLLTWLPLEAENASRTAEVTPRLTVQ